MEVGPRDGLQNEDVLLDTDAKVELIRRCVSAGVRRIEVASFVHPKLVPQMADAEDVVAALPDDDPVSYIGLALNRRGLDRALETKVDEVNFVVSATDSFNRRNQGAAVEESLREWEEMAGTAKAAGRKATVIVSVAFGCPYEGEVSIDRLAEIARRAFEAGADEIALGDTIGVAAPSDVTARVEAVAAAVDGVPIRCHFHNTRNTGIANAYAAWQAGVAALDASVGGIGGCPFAPNATGNIATEDLVYMLDRMGVKTGVDAAGLVETSIWLEGHLGEQVPALLGRAGPFP